MSKVVPATESLRHPQTEPVSSDPAACGTLGKHQGSNFPGEEGGERREVPGQGCRGRRGGRQSFRPPSPARAPSVQPRPSGPVEPPSRAGALRAALVQPRRAAGLGLMQPPRPGKGDGEMALREHCTSATAWYAGGPPGLHRSPLPPAWRMGLGPAERPVPRAGADS